MRKGSVDLITLVIAIIPMVLFIFISGYLIIEVSVKSDLNTQVDFKEKKFESTMALTHLVSYQDSYEEIHNYSNYPEDSSVARSILDSKIEESTKYLEEPDLIRRPHRIKIIFPGSSDYLKEGSSEEPLPITTEANVASPKIDPVVVEVGIE